MENEIWVDVKGYEGLYMVSNLLRLKRIGGNVKRGNHTLFVPEKFIGSLDNGKGYLRAKLTKNNVSKRIMLHKIIAEAFVENPNGFNVVNHINGIKKDNRIENLEWCTQSENCKHAIRNKLRSAKTKNGYSVINTITGEVFDSIKSVSESSKHGHKCKTFLAKKLNGKIYNNTPYVFYKLKIKQLTNNT